MKYSFQPVKNFSHNEKPVYQGSFRKKTKLKTNTLKIISWNIRFGVLTSLAMQEIINHSILSNFDVLLLQEMDLNAVVAVSKKFNCSYVYVPAVISQKTNKMFGNAIISKHPLFHPKKKILPYRSAITGHIRSTVNADILWHNKKITLTSIHAELILLIPSVRTKQRHEVFNGDVGKHPYRIIGGDFNTLRKSTVTSLTQYAKDKGFENVSSPSVPTFRISKISRTLDHIFIKGLHIVNHGVVHKTSASDHFPVWAVVN